MKITDPDIIKSGETDLIDSIKEKLDWGIIEDLNKEKLSLTTLECTDGDIIVHNNRVAYKLNFEVKACFSVLFDREGNILESQTVSQNEHSSSPIIEDAIEFESPFISDEDFSEFEKDIDTTDNLESEDYALSPSDLIEELGLTSESDFSGQSEIEEPVDGSGNLEIPQDLYVPDGAEITDKIDTSDDNPFEELEIEDSITLPEAEPFENSSILEDSDLLSDLNPTNTNELTDTGLSEFDPSTQTDLDDLDLLEDLDISDLVDGQTDSENSDLPFDEITALDGHENDSDEEISDNSKDSDMIILPNDEDLGILEEITGGTENQLEKALENSQEFWNQEDVTSSNTPPGRQNDPLNEIFKKSQNFWAGSGEDTSKKNPAANPANELKTALSKSQNFWTSDEKLSSSAKKPSESQIVEINDLNQDKEINRLNSAFIKSQNFWLKK